MNSEGSAPLLRGLYFYSAFVRRNDLMGDVEPEAQVRRRSPDACRLRVPLHSVEDPVESLFRDRRPTIVHADADFVFNTLNVDGDSGPIGAMLDCVADQV